MNQQKTNFESICYKQDFLKKVIARIDLVSPIIEIQKELPKEIADIVLKSFPLMEPKKSIMQEFQLSPKSGVKNLQRNEMIEWYFHGKNRKKTLTITPTSIILSYDKFNTYVQMRDEYFKIIEIFFNYFKNALGNRLGLRYINEIFLPDDNPFSWEEYLNSKLLGLFNFCENNNSLSRIFHNLEYNFGDFNLKFQFGMHNPDYPANIIKKIFILDYDAHYLGSQEKDDIFSNLDKFHDKIQYLFEYCIKDKLRNILNGK